MDLRERLFGSSRFLAFVESVRQQLSESEPDNQDVKVALEAEKEQLNQRCRGWIQSLSDPGLNHSLRMAVQEQFNVADLRLKEIELQLSQLDSRTDQIGEHLSVESVVERLVRLESILDGENASAVNLELAQHIDSIRCKPSGEVTLKLCRLGAIAELPDFINVVGKSPVAPPASTAGRRRTKRNVASMYDDDEAAETANNFAVDPGRFSELGPEWFAEVKFQVPEKKSWAEQHAVEVASFRLENKSTMDETAAKFGVSVPTIRAALRIAKSEHGLVAFGKRLSNATWKCWFRVNASRVDEYMRQPGATIAAAAQHFGKAEVTIKKAMQFAASQRSSQYPESDEAA